MDKWKKIRLELARSEGFPGGSVSRGFLILLPLDGEGQIDRALFSLKPHQATVRRYWSTEPDEAGNVVPIESGWALRCNGGPDRLLLLGGQPIRLGDQVSVLEPDGGVLPFTVASIR
ncbi:MAG TPA: hypothetical protein VIK68_00290 [Sphingomicrobium sp.]